MSETEVAVVDPSTEQGREAPEVETLPVKPSRRKSRAKVSAPEDDAATVEFDASRIASGLEAMLITMDRPVPAAQLAEALSLGEDGRGASVVHRGVELLNQQYDETKRTFRVEKVAGGYRLMTRPDFSWAVTALHGVREGQRLTRAAVETLAIVAYRQPITRAEIEAIRGVAAGDILRALLDRRLVAIVGRAEELGRPMLYGTGKRFLEIFGLASLKDLPSVGELFPGVEIKTPKRRVISTDDAGTEVAPAADGATA